MHKRLPLLALCLTAVALGTTSCGTSGDADDSRPRASAPPSGAAASASAGASPVPQGRGLTGLLPKFFLKTLRDNYPDLDHISDDVLVAHGDAFCTIRGAALGEQFKKSMRQLGTTKEQTSRIMGAAHGLCRDKDDQLFQD
ncbi:hypothetical protein ACQUSR_03610 [Streptomyces sp. P1-3]|uniref:hypothetical protein n=1 Tax=Streptomyces sp. P1-3 TaxID=3421658 RepID=UPI003D35A140